MDDVLTALAAAARVAHRFQWLSLALLGGAGQLAGQCSARGRCSVSAVIAKTRGSSWRFCAVDAETGAWLGQAVDLSVLLWRLSRTGYHQRTFQLRRPVSL
jgi:hypothetical protein